MIISYKLNKNLTGRAAAMLTWNLSKAEGEVRVIGEEVDRLVNAKSLVGLLSGCFKSDSNIQILIDNESEVKKVKEAFNEVGKEILN